MMYTMREENSMSWNERQKLIQGDPEREVKNYNLNWRRKKPEKLRVIVKKKKKKESQRQRFADTEGESSRSSV